jgi:hypothetical protein
MAKKFKPHMMYKGKKAVKAKTMKDHLRLAKEGYGHEDPYKKNDNKPKFEFGGKMISADSARKKLKSAREKNGYETFNKGGKVKSKVNEAGNYTKPAMRKRLFNAIKAGTKGGRAGQWSARKAQLLALRYKKNGGGYKN